MGSKENLRKEYLIKRKNIKNKLEKSNIIYEKIINSEKYINSKVIALYKSLKDEVDTNRLINYSLSIGKIVLLPKTYENEMNFFKIEKNEQLTKSKFGVEEPKEDFDKLCSSEEIDLMILPGVCFDKNLNRIGFGKGYYDRYLENSNSIYKIGICFKEQITKDILPHDTYDIRLNEIICD